MEYVRVRHNWGSKETKVNLSFKLTTSSPTTTRTFSGSSGQALISGCFLHPWLYSLCFCCVPSDTIRQSLELANLTTSFLWDASTAFEQSLGTQPLFYCFPIRTGAIQVMLKSNLIPVLKSPYTLHIRRSSNCDLPTV